MQSKSSSSSFAHRTCCTGACIFFKPSPVGTNITQWKLSESASTTRNKTKKGIHRHRNGEQHEEHTKTLERCLKDGVRNFAGTQGSSFFVDSKRRRCFCILRHTPGGTWWCGRSPSSVLFRVVGMVVVSHHPTVRPLAFITL